MTTAATATDRGALAQSLRALKLSGMLDTLDARLAQARAGELGHLDFLQVLCEDEIARRETAALARRLRHARFEKQATLEGFDFAAYPKLPAAADPRPGRPAVAARRASRSSSTAPSASAKAMSPRPSAHLAIRHGADVRFLKTSRVLADLAGGHADRTWDKRLRELTRPAVLDPRRLRHARTHRHPGRRPLRTDHRTRRPLPDPHLKPGTRRLVPAVPQPRRRRIPARPAHQHQPPSLHERPQLPAEQTTRACHARREARHHVTLDTGQDLGNYVSSRPGE